MQKIILTKGLPASGKSTWAREYVLSHQLFKRINKDDLRAMLDNSKYSKSNEQFVLNARDYLIMKALEEGCSVIVDDTNFEEKHEKAVREIANKYSQNNQKKVEVEIKIFDTPLEECIERDIKRANGVGESVIRGMYNKYIKPKPAIDQYEVNILSQDKNLPRAVICDMDGTLALLNGRNPYDTGRCEEDILNPAVHIILSAYSNEIIIVSGREDRFKNQTENWLKKHNIKYSQIFMRYSGDRRSDDVIKREIFYSKISGRYHIDYVLDDRLSVCKLWHSLGLPLFRFGNPEASF